MFQVVLLSDLWQEMTHEELNAVFERCAKAFKKWPRTQWNQYLRRKLYCQGHLKDFLRPIRINKMKWWRWEIDDLLMSIYLCNCMPILLCVMFSMIPNDKFWNVMWTNLWCLRKKTACCQTGGFRIVEMSNF